MTGRDGVAGSVLGGTRDSKARGNACTERGGVWGDARGAKVDETHGEARREGRARDAELWDSTVGAVSGVLDKGLCIATENAQAVCGGVKRGVCEAEDDVGGGAIWLGAKLDGAWR